MTKSSTYVDSFLRLDCAPQIISIAGPQKEYTKEISEAMSIRNIVRDISLEERGKYTVVDLCSGNALIPLMTAFSTPIKHSYAVDNKSRNRHWAEVKKFNYLIHNIYDDSIIKFISTLDNVILTASHPCKKLAMRVVDIYKTINCIKHLIMIPCCIYRKPLKTSEFLRKKLGLYNLWCMYLQDLCSGSIEEDTKILSPCNIILKAKKDV